MKVCLEKGCIIMFNKDLLQQLIDSSGKSLIMLGHEMNISHSTLSLLLRGQSTKPQSETVNSIAKYFNISPDLLLFNLNKEEYFTQNSTIKLASLKNTLEHLMYRSGIVNSSQLHRYTGISIPTIDKILNEETLSPNHNTLSTIAEFFDVSIAQLKGIDPIPKGKVFETIKNESPIPQIKFENIIQWLQTNNKTLIEKYLKTNIVTKSIHSYAFEYKANKNLIISYIVDPEIKPIIGDTIIVFDEDKELKIVEYLTNSTYISITQQKINITSNQLIYGTVIQEIRKRI